jgi:hypothetical protein
MTIINAVFFTIVALLVIALKKIIIKKHSKIFGVKEEDIPTVIYGYLGVYRLLIVVFNLVPYIALLIMKQL